MKTRLGVFSPYKSNPNPDTPLAAPCQKQNLIHVITVGYDHHDHDHLHSSWQFTSPPPDNGPQAEWLRSSSPLELVCSEDLRLTQVRSVHVPLSESSLLTYSRRVKHAIPNPLLPLPNVQ